MDLDWHLANNLDSILSVLIPLTNTLSNLRQLAGQDLMAAGNQIKQNFNAAARLDSKYTHASEKLNLRYQQIGRGKSLAFAKAA